MGNWGFSGWTSPLAARWGVVKGRRKGSVPPPKGLMTSTLTMVVTFAEQQSSPPRARAGDETKQA